jgi:GNAT superfamily N-acetyltransferase
MDPSVARRCNRVLEPLHSALYFAPEQDEYLGAIGLRKGRMPYFAGRAAPMGPVGPSVVVATFYNFNPELVAKYIPRAWTLASAPDIIAARFDAVDAMYRRLLGTEVVESSELAELAGLAREAAEGARPEGRPLYAGHADIAWPTASHLVLWHAITLLREYRGDGHIAALVEAELDGLSALITHTMTSQSFTAQAAQLTRGWSEEQWAQGLAALRARGLVDEADGLTEQGTTLRERVEATTDRLSLPAWTRLDVEKADRLTDLGRKLRAAILAAGAFPAAMFGKAAPHSG